MNTRTFFTSDSHFGHDNIIRLSHRHIPSRMDHDALMDTSNSVASPDVWGGKLMQIAEIPSAMTRFDADADKKDRRTFRLRERG